MAIPNSITKEHVIKAIEKVEITGIPKKRKSKKYHLYFNGKNYPPKYIISIANEYANGEAYAPDMFSGGDEANSFLIKLGFTVNPNQDYVIFDINIPELEPKTRDGEYKLYGDKIRDKVIFEYLFNAQSHRWIDEHVIGLNPIESRGYQAMGILHFIGIKGVHKGIFKDYDIQEAIEILEQQKSDFGLVIQALQRLLYKIVIKPKNENAPLEINNLDLESIVSVSREQFELTNTEKEQIIKARIGQSEFKKSLLSLGSKCGLCGVTDERFLVASHIKPWSKSNHRERLDVNNGLLLCPNHDALFDKGSISFQENGRILISRSLDEATKTFLNINESMEIKMSIHQKKYMEWHRLELFK